MTSWSRSARRATAIDLRPVAAALLLVALIAPPGARADALRCGSRLVTEGDTVDEVLAYCGEPADRKRTWIRRQPRFEYGGQEVPFPGEEDVPVDLWTYDFGANKLMRRIRFVAGKVDSIETLDYGSNR